MYPARLVFDLELANPIPEDSGHVQWGRAAECGVGVLTTWHTEGIAPDIFLLDADRFPRNDGECQRLRTAVRETPGVVSWNGVGFDLPVLEEVVPGISKGIVKHVDLMVICAALWSGVSSEELCRGITIDWRSRWNPRLKGWSLNAVATSTLGEEYVKTMQGKMAPIEWGHGYYGKVISYCIHDVALTRALYRFAYKKEFLLSGNMRVDIPREVL